MRLDALPLNQPIWFDLMTSDVEAARRYYGELLPWQYDVSGPEMGHYSMANVGGASAAGIGALPPGATFPPVWTVYFGVENAEATCAAITKAGGSVHTPPQDVAEFGRFAVAQDPTGAVFAIWQPKQHRGAQIINEPGAMAWCEVNTRDAKAAKEFYAKVFGLTAKSMEVPGSPGPYDMLFLGETPACGVLQMTEEWGDMPPHWMTYLAVQDVEKAKATVLKNGGQVPFGPIEIPYGKFMVTMDPQGAAVSLIELNASPPPSRG
ncbi:MAG: VOC family protein [Gemmatimonadaceae bacterium]|nr:VOC family protein [Gemmatimonadaceae bacterium]